MKCVRTNGLVEGTVVGAGLNARAVLLDRSQFKDRRTELSITRSPIRSGTGVAATDLAWAMAGPDLYRKLVLEQGWTGNTYECLLADVLVAALPLLAEHTVSRPRDALGNVSRRGAAVICDVSSSFPAPELHSSPLLSRMSLPRS